MCNQRLDAGGGWRTFASDHDHLHGACDIVAPPHHEFSAPPHKLRAPMATMMHWFVVLLLCTASLSVGQQYDGRARVRRRGGRGGVLVGIMSGIVGGTVGGWLQARRLRPKFDKEKKDLLKYIQMQESLYKDRDNQWTAAYQKLYKAYEKLETETLERDYEEFKAPDTDGDDMISRAEFAIYVRKYLSSFPELSEKDFPKFEEFDLNHDGTVSFEEWQLFLAQQKIEEAQKGKKGNGLLDALYTTSNSADSFSSLQQNLGGGRGGAGGRGQNARGIGR